MDRRIEGFPCQLIKRVPITDLQDMVDNADAVIKTGAFIPSNAHMFDWVIHTAERLSPKPLPKRK